MQDKHFLITHYKEDRDIFINKLNYKKTIFHVGDNPQPGDVIKNKDNGFHTFFAEWILENYDNLPDYVVICQADPTDHVHEPLLAVDATFASDFGSLCYGRSIHNQYATDWIDGLRIPIRLLAHELGIGFFNDNNTSKSIYCLYPGEINFISRKRLLEKPKSFYQKMIDLDDIPTLYSLYDKNIIPQYVFDDIKNYFPEQRKANKKELLEFLKKRDLERKQGYFGLTFETLWLIAFSDNKTFKMLEKSQAVIGNKLYFDTRKLEYNPNFKFNIFPYNDNSQKTRFNLKLLENSWFDYDCPYYLKWREKLIEKTIWEGEQRGFDGKQLLELYDKIGYKHISL